MNKTIKVTVLAALAVVQFVVAQPELERGKSLIEVPAVEEGLCVHSLFQAGMVLQREKPLPVWGWAAPGESVTVSFGQQTQKTTAGKDRTWKVDLDAMAANATPQAMTITGSKKTLTLDNILVGDIWVLGGQSNMEFELAKLVNGRLEIVSANFPQIRYITIPQLDGPDYRESFPRQYKWSSWSKRHLKQGYWEVCSPETVKDLSGLGYAFIRRVHMATQIPIGVIDASRGGTTVETWTPRSVLDEIKAPETQALLAEWGKKVAEFDPKADLENRIARHHDWLKRMEKDGREVPEDRKQDPTDLRPGPAMDQNRPGNCYASQIAPISGFPVKGAIFHQGFNNCFSGTSGSKMYYQVFGKMITAWRDAFGDPALPFGIISLCTAGEPQDDTNYLAQMLDSGAEIREAQYRTFLDFKAAGDENIGFASSFDQRRSWYHPQIKIPVGERIAKWALATQYGMSRELKWEPPTYEMTVEDGKIILAMGNSVGPHNDGPIHGFAIAGEDKKFQPAKAEYLVIGKDSRGRPRTDRRKIVLSSPLVPAPVHFRHAWARNPQTNLKADGIPFATQRSDNWTMEDLYEAYTGKLPASPGSLERSERGELSRALKAADLERRLYEARALIAENAEE